MTINVTKTKTGKFFTYKIGDRIVKAKSKIDYQFCCICYEKDTKRWGYLGFSRSLKSISNICEKFKTYKSFENVQVVEIVK